MNNPVRSTHNETERLFRVPDAVGNLYCKPDCSDRKYGAGGRLLETEDKKYSIITGYLGTPAQMYDEKGQLTWEARLDMYGKVANFTGRSLSDCPFRYQGQYEDSETGLYYNRFRYYDPSTSNCISQDPIRLEGGNPTLYGYASNPNLQTDPFGLDELYALLWK
jgi:RHS repeat-associated protein